MPPKMKVTANGEASEAGGAFRWTLQNERKLLVLIQGRYLTGEDYERLVGVFPGTNLNGVKIKVSRFRVEQRKLYDEYGWVLPEGAAKLKGPATPKKSVASTKKRGAGESDDDLEGTPAKKEKRPGAQRAKKEDVKKASDEEIEEAGGIKEETFDDDM